MPTWRGGGIEMQDIDLQNDRFTISSTFSAGVYREKKEKRTRIGTNSKAYCQRDQRIFHEEGAGQSSGSLVFPNPRTGNAYRVASLSRLWKRIRKKANLRIA